MILYQDRVTQMSHVQKSGCHKKEPFVTTTFEQGKEVLLQHLAHIYNLDFYRTFILTAHRIRKHLVY